MQEALNLAAIGIGAVAPNPMVGCVIVSQGEIIGRGYHQQYGGPHAEVNAIASVHQRALLPSSILYVNLEPCAHYGKTPPCADLIIQQKIPSVVIGSVDSHSLVKGRGIEKLVKAGVNVQIGVLEKACKELNKRFFMFHEQKRPYIILKWAQSKDGIIAPEVENGAAPKIHWISGMEARTLSHQWRSEEQAILVGTETVLKDNPRLTTRMVNGRNPLRVIFDRELRIPDSFYVLDQEVPTLVITEKQKDPKENLEYACLPFDQYLINNTLRLLQQKNIQSLMVEGGAYTLQAFISQGAWDEARIFTSSVQLKKGVNAPILKEALNVSVDRIGEDWLDIYHRITA